MHKRKGYLPQGMCMNDNAALNFVLPLRIYFNDLHKRGELQEIYPLLIKTAS